MSVRVCGHRLRVKKTIKPYTFFKNVAALAVLSLLLAAPASAADASPAVNKASSASVSPCSSAHVPGGMDKTVLPENENKDALSQAQRPAGSSSAAMMLAMALGVRTVSGPIEHVRHVRPSPVRQAALPSGVKCLGLNAGETARLAMER